MELRLHIYFFDQYQGESDCAPDDMRSLQNSRTRGRLRAHVIVFCGMVRGSVFSDKDCEP